MLKANITVTGLDHDGNEDPSSGLTLERVRERTVVEPIDSNDRIKRNVCSVALRIEGKVVGTIEVDVTELHKACYLADMSEVSLEPR